MPDATLVGHGTVGTCNPGYDCCPHGRAGTNGEGSAIFEVDGRALHCIGHTGPTNCPHGGTFESVQGSAIFEVEGKPVTLVGHSTVCVVCGVTGAHSNGSALLEAEI
jgi:uncharacterized Zn-binding protein involved in type VI secretion